MTERMDRDTIAGIVKDAIQGAVDFVESTVGEERQKAMRYYNGEVDIKHAQGLSGVVATKCRDAVRSAKPPLMRAFLASDKPVEFVPKSQKEVADAEQATSFATYKFQELNGYQLIRAAFDDALTQKTGILKVYWEDSTYSEIDEYTGLSPEQMAILETDEDVTIIEATVSSETQVDPVTGVEVEAPAFDARVEYVRPAGKICAEAIAPEDFFVSSDATSIEDCYICGHRNSEMRVGDVAEMSEDYDFDEILSHAGDRDDAYAETADQERRGYTDTDEDENSADPAMRKVMVTEAYMRMDIEGTGLPKLYRFVCLGSEYHLLDYDLADMVPFAVFEIDPVAHAFFGKSLVDLVMPDQDVATSMLRGLIDNVNLTNTPRLLVNDTQVNMDDLLNPEVGAIWRVKNMDAVRPFITPFVGNDLLPAMQYFDQQVENKTGVSQAAAGLDPDKLQNTTATAANFIQEAATAQVELMARNLAEGGMKQFFRLIMHLSRQHPDEVAMMRVDGDFVEVDPRSWRADMDMVANVGIGTGGEIEREMVLREILQHQLNMYFQDPNNGMVLKTHIRNTFADILKLGGIHNADRHFTPFSFDIEQKMAGGAQPPKDPNASIAAAEVQKAQISAEADIQREAMKGEQARETALLRADLDAQKANQDDDRKRDEMDMELALRAAKLFGEYGLKVDEAEIRAMQAMPRI